jgi:hypothetical protein
MYHSPISTPPHIGTPATLSHGPATANIVAPVPRKGVAPPMVVPPPAKLTADMLRREQSAQAHLRRMNSLVELPRRAKNQLDQVFSHMEAHVGGL